MIKRTSQTPAAHTGRISKVYETRFSSSKNLISSGRSAVQPIRRAAVVKCATVSSEVESVLKVVPALDTEGSHQAELSVVNDVASLDCGGRPNLLNIFAAEDPQASH